MVQTARAKPVIYFLCAAWHGYYVVLLPDYGFAVYDDTEVKILVQSNLKTDSNHLITSRWGDNRSLNYYKLQSPTKPEKENTPRTSFPKSGGSSAFRQFFWQTSRQRQEKWSWHLKLSKIKQNYTLNIEIGPGGVIDREEDMEI